MSLCFKVCLKRRGNKNKQIRQLRRIQIPKIMIKIRRIIALFSKAGRRSGAKTTTK